jgi:hypothetical protein
MMVMQVLTIAGLLVLYGLVLMTLLGRFRRMEFTKFLFLPMAVFGFGYCLRFSGKPPIIDLGFFLTDFSGLFVSVLFTTFLLLGQLKYWKK